MIIQDIGTDLQNARKSRRYLPTSFGRKGISVGIVDSLENNKGSVQSLLKYCKFMGLRIKLEALTPLISPKLIKLKDGTTHISVEGDTTICGRKLHELKQKYSTKEVTEIDLTCKTLCRRCLSGYIRRIEQQNSPPKDGL